MQLARNPVLALYWPCTGLQCDPDFVYFAIDNFISLMLGIEASVPATTI